MALTVFGLLKRAVIKCFKFAGLVLLLATILVSGWIYWGSIDAESFNDHGLLVDYHRKPEGDKHQNGIYDIPFVLDRKYKTLIGAKSRIQLKQFLVNMLWDTDSAHKYRSRVRGELTPAIQSLEKPYYQFPEHDDSDLRDSVSYSAIDELYLTLLLESQWQYFENGSVAEALKYLKAAMEFNARLANAQGLGYIAYKIAATNRRLVYPWLSVLSREASKEQLIELRAYLNDINSQHEKALSGVFSAEFMKRYRYFNSELMQNSVFTRRPFEESGLGYKAIDWDHRFSVINGLFNDFSNLGNHNNSWVYFLDDYFPRFYYHKNYFGEKYSKIQVDLKSQAFLPCEEKGLAGNPAWEQGVDLVTTAPWYLPNHVQYIEYLGHGERQYQFGECQNRQWGEVLAASLAIASYQNEMGVLPDSLQQLLPDYIDKLPRDRFTGKILGYSKQQRWLYASGANYSSDGGSVDALLPSVSLCSSGPCVKNPTYALYDQRPFPVWSDPTTGVNRVTWQR